MMLLVLMLSDFVLMKNLSGVFCDMLNGSRLFVCGSGGSVLMVFFF